MAGDKRARRIRRREGFKVSAKQSRRRRLLLADGSCRRPWAEHANTVWTCAYVQERIHDGGKYRLLNLVDEFTREGGRWKSWSPRWLCGQTGSLAVCGQFKAF